MAPVSAPALPYVVGAAEAPRPEAPRPVGPDVFERRTAMEAEMEELEARARANRRSVAAEIREQLFRP